MSDNQKIKLEQAKILYQQSPILLVGVLTTVAMVLFLFKDRIDDSYLLWWAGSVVILNIARLYLVSRFWRTEKIFSPHFWLNLFAVTALFSGVSWAILLQVLNSNSDQELLQLSFILTGMAAASLVTLSSYLPAYIMFIVPLALSFVVKLLTIQTADYSSIVYLVIVFLMAMLGFSILVNINTWDSIKLRLKNISLLEDVHIQKELAEKASNDKSRFLAATSHDLRQPLYALDLYLGALQAELHYPKQFELLDKVKLSSGTLSELLNALMDVSKLDSGGVLPHKKDFDLKNLVAEVCAEFEQQAKDKGIELQTDLENAYVHTDNILLGRMLRNLISNAVNHNENCQLIVSMNRSKSLIRIDIKDTGKGISNSELDNIFSEFYQLHNPERDRNKGIGLGLAIVKRLSGLLEIPIEVDSELGAGTCFSLIIPQAKASHAIAGSSEVEAISNMELAGLFIIVIDDEKTVVDAARALLRSWGCEVLVVSSQVELITTLEQDNYPVPDLVISDYRLRDNLTSLDAIQAVQKHFKSDIPAIIVTGDSSEKIRSEIAASNHTFLLKPINSQTLRKEIGQLLKS